MTIRDIIYFPNKILRQASQEIAVINEDIKQLAQDMIETMQANNGVGLAAIQIAVPLCIFVMQEEDQEPIIAINPQIIHRSKELASYKEGCLSIPEIYEEIQRPAQINLKFYNLQNEIEEIGLNGLLATCAQHELDHLNGILFFDHLSKIKRDRLINKFYKQQRNGV